MTKEDLNKIDLPDSPGVYFFIGPKPQAEVLYIGKATSLRDRVRSYFNDDVISSRGSRIVDMVTKTTSIKTFKTDSVLEALILEAEMIKKNQPRYNVKEKDDRSFNYVVITDEDFPRVLVVRGKDLKEGIFGAGSMTDTTANSGSISDKISNQTREQIKKIYGPYPQGSVLRAGMNIIRKIFPYRDKCIPNTKACFNRHIGLCPGVCSGEISSKDYKEIIKNISLFFEGKKEKILKNLQENMNHFARNLQFEKANETKKVLFALQHIKDITLIKAEKNIKTSDKKLVPKNDRFEAYDVAHTGGTGVVGVMTVIEDGELKKSDYRMFRIKTAKGGDDQASLAEMLVRRLKHKEWPLPSAIVVDGGELQKAVAEKVLTEYHFFIDVIAVVKDSAHKPHHFLGNNSLILSHKNEFLLLNSEAHRFALKFHRKTRGLQFLR